MKSTARRCGCASFKQIFVLEVADRPGEFDELAKCLSSVKIGIESLYGTADAVGNAKVVVSVSQNEKAEPILDKFIEKTQVAA